MVDTDDALRHRNLLLFLN